MHLNVTGGVQVVLQTGSGIVPQQRVGCLVSEAVLVAASGVLGGNYERSLFVNRRNMGQ